MIEGKRVCAVFPAYNAQATLEKTFKRLPKDIVDDIVRVDDCSTDGTVEEARKLGIHIVEHAENKGYGGNQKTCYSDALERGADIVVMIRSRARSYPCFRYRERSLSRCAGVSDTRDRCSSWWYATL